MNSTHGRKVAWIAALAVASVMTAVTWAGVRSVTNTRTPPLAAEARPVSVAEATSAEYRARRRYVATVQPWLEAKIGPQLVSGYADTVLYRPGAAVKRGEVLATLDCRNASASAQAVAMTARALDSRQAAITKESARVQSMRDGGFVSENEAEKIAADSASSQAELLATKAKLLGTSLQVGDCVLRAPFDGEIVERSADPGTFVHPGTAMVRLVDRSIVRVVADVPEIDYALIAPGTKVDIAFLATGTKMRGTVSRRVPAADASTRTIHFEVDLPDPERVLPIGTTAELGVDVGQPVEATSLPLRAATVRGEAATVFVVDGDKARKLSMPVLGELAGMLFVARSSLPPGSRVVTDGRALLTDGDRVHTPTAAAAVESSSGNRGAL